jgi:uncharacterized protein (DUF983 family)
MLFRCFCPRCGKKKEYIAEQVGQSSHCDNCGGEFTLQANHGRVTWHVIAATAFVIFIIGGIAARFYWKAHKYDRIPTSGSTASYSIFDDDE